MLKETQRQCVIFILIDTLRQLAVIVPWFTLFLTFLEEGVRKLIFNVTDIEARGEKRLLDISEDLNHAT